MVSAQKKKLMRLLSLLSEGIDEKTVKNMPQ